MRTNGWDTVGSASSLVVKRLYGKALWPHAPWSAHVTGRTISDLPRHRLREVARARRRSTQHTAGRTAAPDR